MSYGRPSSAGDGLDSKKFLVDWSAAQAAIGVLLSKTVQSELSTLVNEYKGDPWRNGDEDSPHSGKKRLIGVVEKAREVAGANQASSGGTEFHKLAEITNDGKTPYHVPEHLVDFLSQYREAVKRVEFIKQELFVVNDELRLAGSLDYLVRLPDGRVVVSDLKTGRQNHEYPLGTICQVATYANSMVYDQATGERSPIHPDLDLTTGLLIHFPIQTKNPEVKFYELPLERGLDAARMSQKVIEMRKAWKLTTLDLAA